MDAGKMGAIGPELNVANFYALEALYLLSRKAISRRKLMLELGLSESKTRTLLQHMQGIKYIKPTTKGYALTEKGMKGALKLQGIIKDMKSIDLGNLIDSRKGFALHAKHLRSGMRTYEIRDIAIKAGAEGALVLRASNNGLKFVDPATREYEQKLHSIERQLKGLRNNDTVIVSFAQNAENAKAGLWNIIENLINAG